MKKQKRYYTEYELLKAIAKQRSNMTKLRVKLASNQKLTEEEVLRFNKRVRTIEDSTIPNLIRALAAFRTPLLPGITTDPAVTVR